jgi:hypothetical protein
MRVRVALLLRSSAGVAGQGSRSLDGQGRCCKVKAPMLRPTLLSPAERSHHESGAHHQNGHISKVVTFSTSTTKVGSIVITLLHQALAGQTVCHLRQQLTSTAAAHFNRYRHCSDHLVLGTGIWD